LTSKSAESNVSLLQRCGAHLASGTDIWKAVEAGRAGVKAAIEGYI